ncbi:leucine-rich repeat domain-containing protein [Trueperella pyogenes]|uniref:leucine-rich repeat domain-containing protein n=1 Tax=Trueperella pyogenes TaxID=1661 RepID=UPI00324C0DED
MNNTTRPGRRRATLALLSVAAVAVVNTITPFAVADSNLGSAYDEILRERFGGDDDFNRGPSTPGKNRGDNSDRGKDKAEKPAAPAPKPAAPAPKPKVAPSKPAAPTPKRDQRQPFPAPPTEKVDQTKSPIKDSSLRSCIRLVPEQRIGGTGEVTAEHVANITRLSCVGRDITNLSGLEGAKNLRELDLTQTKVSDLSPLAALPNLEVLRLDKTQVKDLSKLGAPAKLTKLYLASNGLTSLAGLKPQPKLTELSLLNNALSDITEVSGLPALEELNITGNSITSLKPLAKLTKMRELRASKNKISDLSPLSGLKNLSILELGTNQISDVATLATLPNLGALSVRDNKITDLSPLTALKKLYRLDVSNNPDSNNPALKKIAFVAAPAGFDPNQGIGLINVGAPKTPSPNSPDASAPAPQAPSGALEHWYGQLQSATGASIAPQSCDFTGDGKPDVVVGAWKTNNLTGMAYVIPNGTPSGDLDAQTGVTRIFGAEKAGMAGFNVNCLGDVNGDGRADIGISNHNVNRGYVVFGSATSADIHLDNLDGRGYAITAGTADKIGTGWQIAPMGDLNGDKLADIAVVSQGGGPAKRGEVVVLPGKKTTSDIAISDPSALLRIHGNGNSPVFSVAKVGDMNGDGVRDIAVGGYYGTVAGALKPATGVAWIISGKARGTIDVTKKFDGFQINGPLRGGDRLGMSFANLGDMNGDGYDDVAIGASPSKGTGSVAVVLGSSRFNAVSIDPAAQFPVSDADGARGWWITDSNAGKGLGYSIAAVPATGKRSGTLVMGDSDTARAIAIDTSALTAKNANGGLVDLSNVASSLKVEIDSAGDRLGRSVGVIDGFGSHAGPLMLAGADRANLVQGRGSVILAALPKTHAISTTDKADTPAPADTAKGSDQKADKSPATAKVQATANKGENLAFTGASVTLLGGIGLLVLGAGVLLRRLLKNS